MQAPVRLGMAAWVPNKKRIGKSNYSLTSTEEKRDQDARKWN